MDMLGVCKQLVQLKYKGESDIQIEHDLDMDPDPAYVPRQLAQCHPWMALICTRMARDEKMGMTYEQMRGDLGWQNDPSQITWCELPPASPKTKSD